MSAAAARVSYLYIEKRPGEGAFEAVQQCIIQATQVVVQQALLKVCSLQRGLSLQQGCGKLQQHQHPLQGGFHQGVRLVAVLQ